MKALWAGYAARFEALSGRERISAFMALLLISVYIVFALAIEPTQRRAKALRTLIAQQTAEIHGLSQQQARRAPDPDAVNRARSEDLKRKLGELDETLRTMQRELVSADRMNSLLQEMLARDAGLQLVALRALPVTPLTVKGEQSSSVGATAGGSKPTNGDTNVYRRGVEITIRGGYDNLHAYLTRLERSPWRMFWWRAQLTSDGDARLTMVITIYTLSLDRAWLQV